MNDKSQPLEDFYPALAKEESVRAMLLQEYGDRAPTLLDAMENRTEIPDEFEFFSEQLLEHMNDCAEEVDSFEIECLTSYSTTSTVSIKSFSEIYWVSNCEFGDICYFSNEEDAMKAAQEEFGHFDNP